MLTFNDLLKGFKANYSAAMSAALVFAVMGLSAYVIQLHDRLEARGADRLKAQIDCAQEVAERERYWRSRMDSLQRAELVKTQQQVNELNKLLNELKK